MKAGIQASTSVRSTYKGPRKEIAALLNGIPIDFGGGCSLDKAYLMAWLIRRFGLQSTLDIGVYRGRSLFPQAIAHKLSTGGVVYGVDPWSSHDARQNDNPELRNVLDKFADSTDFQGIYQSVQDLRQEFRLENNCLLVRQTSANAIEYFKQKGIEFDLIHIDGNHDTDRVTLDVENYLPRLRRKGFLVVDDVSWSSVKPVYETLARKMPVIYKGTDEPNDFAVLWNNSSRLEAIMLSATMKLMASKPSSTYHRSLRALRRRFLRLARALMSKNTVS